MWFFGGTPSTAKAARHWKSLVARGPSPQRFLGFATMSLRGGVSADSGPIQCFPPGGLRPKEDFIWSVGPHAQLALCSARGQQFHLDLDAFLPNASSGQTVSVLALEKRLDSFVFTPIPGAEESVRSRCRPAAAIGRSNHPRHRPPEFAQTGRSVRGRPNARFCALWN